MFDAFVGSVRGQVEARLVPWLDARVAEARPRGPDLHAVADALRSLVLRGGKRMRAVLLAAAYVAAGGDDASAVAPAGAALELLQAYLLTHDDWMDGDRVRRGGPSVPAMMEAHFREAHAAGEPADPPGAGAAAAAAILAGDLAASWALAAMLELPFAPGRMVDALRELARVEEEVVQGQLLDVAAGARGSGAPGAGDLGAGGAAAREVETTYALKTASYTVRGPVVIGARLAGAAEEQVASLAAFAEPLGVAFQLRDDLLGAFGDPGATGKPSGGDLRKGKRTPLVLEAMRDPAVAAVLGRVFGRHDASDAAVGAALAALEGCGARARIEGRIAALAEESRAAIAAARLTDTGRELLAQAIAALTERDR